MFRYLEEELELPEHQLEFARDREQLHDMQMLSSPPEAIILPAILNLTLASIPTLSEEIEMIKNYVALEELRFGDRLQVSFDNQIDKQLEAQTRQGIEHIHLPAGEPGGR